MTSVATTATVLVPLDGTMLAEQALPTAMSIARRRHGRMELFLVHEPRRRDGLEDWPWAVDSIQTDNDYIADKARAWSESLDGRVGFGAGEGEIGRAICHRAREVGASLIVMATHARTGFARLLSGSVGDTIVRQSHVPVLLLRPPASNRRITRTPLHIRRVLIPVDATPAREELCDALNLVVDRGATELLLLQAIPPLHRRVHGIRRIDPVATQRLFDATEGALGDASATLAQATGCDVYPHIAVDENPARAIRKFARRYSASLIAMTTHGRGASRLFLGSVTDAVLRDGTSPLLVVRPDDP